MKTITFFAIIIAGGLFCAITLSYKFSVSKRENKVEQSTQEGTVIHFPTWDVWLATVEHEGHLWIVTSSYKGGVTTEHHPDCICKK